MSLESWSVITKVHASYFLRFLFFLRPRRMATVYIMDHLPVGEWNVQERLFIFGTYFTT